MKNVKVLYEPEEIRDYFRKTFKTELFKTEMEKPGSFINTVVERAAKYPLYVYEFSDHPHKDTPDKDKTEWAHFGAWFGGITEREYSNPAISDAYYLHELYHKGFMAYLKDGSFEGWKDKMFRNELNASVTSEIELYFQHPEFRDQTFDQEILADRYLKDPKIRKQWQNDPIGTREDLMLKRREVMIHENLNDPVEYWIHKFSQQNEAFAAIWSRRYKQIEAKMQELHDDIDGGMSRKEAMDKYMAWLTSPEITKGTEIPFPDEAHAFAATYQLNNRHYLESVAKGDMPKENKVVNAIKDAYGKDALKHVGHDLEAANGIPNWSERKGKGYQIMEATGGHSGRFILHYAYNDSGLKHLPKSKMNADDIDVFLEVRKAVDVKNMGEALDDGKKYYGAVGGYVSQDRLEQPLDGACRENGEEWVDDKGKPVINLKPGDLKFISEKCEGTDYRNPERPVFYNGYRHEMSKKEYEAAKIHVVRLQTDAQYKQDVEIASHGEVTNMERMTLTDALKLPQEAFTHPHEWVALQELGNVLLNKQRQHDGRL